VAALTTNAVGTYNTGMNVVGIILTVLGLSVFETVSSIDNAIINAEVLSGMRPKSRRWFLTWGILFAVFVPRGLLPWLIVWIAVPQLGPLEALTATFSSDHLVIEAVETSAPSLLMGGGVFLILLFLHWLFLEPKHFGLIGERFFSERGVWFYAAASVFLTAVVWFALRVGAPIAFAAVIGSTAFFITHGFKENAAEQEQRLLGSAISDVSKLLYLEILDLLFPSTGCSARSPSRSRFPSSCSATAWARSSCGRSRPGTSSGSSGTAT